ncbi:MAG TPA: RimK/LysX family protein [Bacteroidia bacterium]|nr:RimK/LysX family protein [Bacteroidia bacterium]
MSKDNTTEKEKRIIGRSEKVDFPVLGLFDVAAKIDTGAYTTALHCHDICLKMENGKNVLYFKLLDPSHPEWNEQVQCFSEFQEKKIKNSFGNFEKRFIIKTVIKIAGKKINSVVSLTDRGNMRYPVLIGRKLIRNKFIVDVALQNTWQTCNS